MISQSSPRTCNTGAQNTSQSGLVALVDWVSVTFFNVYEPHDMTAFLGIDFTNFKPQKTGGKGYRKCYRFGNIAVYYDGAENMGIHLEISGQGCRQFEVHSSYTWELFFGLILNYDINITRLDIAIDDYEGYFTISTLKRKINKKIPEVRSRFKSAIEIKKIYLYDGSSLGETVYFGSPSSQIQVRFYNKLLERKCNGYDVNENIKHWVRTELQLRDDRAYLAVLVMINKNLSLGALVAGILKNYISFLTKRNDTNKARWPVSPFWSKFLGDVDKLKLTMVAPESTIERSHKWLDKQVKTTLAMMYEAFNQDMRVFYDLINQGLVSLDKKHLEIVNRFKTEYNNMTYDDFIKKIKKDSEFLKNPCLKNDYN